MSDDKETVTIFVGDDFITARERRARFEQIIKHAPRDKHVRNDRAWLVLAAVVGGMALGVGLWGIW